MYSALTTAQRTLMWVSYKQQCSAGTCVAVGVLHRRSVEMFNASATSTYQLLVMQTLLASSTNAGPYLPCRRVHPPQQATGSGGGDCGVCRARCSTRHQHQLRRSDRNRTSSLLRPHVLPGEHLMNQVVGLASGPRRVLRQLAVQLLTL